MAVLQPSAWACAGGTTLLLVLAPFTVTPEESADTLAGVAIKCPYLPAGLHEIPLCAGEAATCVGTPGNDLILGTDGDDVIVAGAGDDVVLADEGDDTVCAGPGNDAVHGAAGNDFLYGDEGTDWLFGARGTDVLDGGPGDGDVLMGGPGLDGGAGTHDYCLQQRELAEVNADSCEIIYPPLGYSHDESEIGPGIFMRFCCP